MNFNVTVSNIPDSNLLIPVAILSSIFYLYLILDQLIHVRAKNNIQVVGWYSEN